MNIQNHIVNDHLAIRVIPNSSQSCVKIINGVRVYVTQVPTKGKANKAVVKLFKKLGFNVEIVKGEKTRNKILRIL